MRPALRVLATLAGLAVLACSDNENVAVSDSATANATPGSPNAAAAAGAVAEAKEAAPSLELPANLVAEANDVQSPEFLSLFIAPADTVRLVNTSSIRLWDLIGVAETPKGDPRTRIPAGASNWTQVSGTRVIIANPTTRDASVTIPAASTDLQFTFRISITNASGGRSMDVNVVVLKR